ncbi:MAG TPA: hypothetical protein VIO12_07635 [Thermoanaerobaculia bacterium]
MEPDRKRRLIILALLLAPLLTLHVLHAPRRGPFSHDPSYYLQVARHVATGDGLMSSVSLYHEGLTPLPQPYDLYPLWPLLLGAVGKIAGLIVAANVLPQLFFVFDLCLFYLLTNRLSGDAAIFRYRGEAVDVGHLVVVLVGLNFIFFEATTIPYTEGLAFALAIGSFLLLESNPGLSGLLAGLSVLTRSQMLVVPVATVFVLALATMWARKVLLTLATYTLTTGVVVGGWLLYASFHRPHRADVSPFELWIHPASLAARIAQALRGLGVAFNPVSDYSYFHSFGPVVLAAVAIVWMRSRNVTISAVFMTGVVSTLILSTFEGNFVPRWLFGSRHSLAFVFMLIPALVIAVVNAPRLVRIAALLLAAGSIVHGGMAVLRDPIPDGRGLSAAENQMVGWLAARQPQATILTTNAQVLSVYAPNNFHWTGCAIDPAKTRLMLRRLPIDYVVVYDYERSCPFVRGLGDLLGTEATFGDMFHRVYLLRVMRKITSTGAPSTRQTASG